MQAQRPVGDTIAIGTGDYLYDSVHLLGIYYISTCRYQNLDYASFSTMMQHVYLPLFQASPEWRYSYIELFKAFPNLYFDAPHISGQQFYTTSEMGKGDTLKVLGLAVCPIVNPDIYRCPYLSDSHSMEIIGQPMPIIDTTIEGRLTEYVQLYSVEGSTLRLRAEGPWRIEDPHRYLQFPSYAAWRGGTTYYNHSFVKIDSMFNAPLYEVLFDTAVLIDDGTFVVAGTHNSNSVRWCDTCSDDLVFTEHVMCFEHLPTCYTASWLDYFNLPHDTVVPPVN